MAMPLHDETYRGHLIRAQAVGKSVKARAIKDGKGVVDTEAASAEQAVGLVKTWLDAQANKRHALRAEGVPGADEFAEAFRRAKLSAAQGRMLRALFEAPDQTLTATQIAVAGGYAKYQVANRFLGQIAREVAEILEYLPQQRDDGTSMWTTTLATGADPDTVSEEGHFRWKLRPQVAEALKALGWFATPQALPARR